MPHSWVGKTISGRYQVDSLLGQGGMSAVYRATDPNLRRVVAIKLIHTHLSDNPEFVNRFKEEAAAVARLRHPNIVQVHDFNIDGETYYMVMEYLMGETLQARLKGLNTTGRSMSYPEVIRFGSQLCDAVGYAHNHGLIHRDIKPANIMLDLNGQAILMDFGIVKMIGGDHQTATGATVGTAMYMSPEQIRSEPVDERTDIYALGVTLYEMISGRPPYQADSALPLMMMVLNDPLPDLRGLRKGVPESLLAVVEKALAKEKADRFPTMGEMAAALQRAQEQLASPASIVTVVDEGQMEAVGATDLASEETVPSQAPTAHPKPAVALDREALPVESPQPAGVGEVAKVSAVPTLKGLPAQPTHVTEKAAPDQGKDASGPNYRRLALAAAALLVIGAMLVGGIVYGRSQRAPVLQTTPVDQPPAPIKAETAQFVVSLARWETDSYIEELAYSPDGNLIGTANNWDGMPFARYRYYGGLWRVDSGSLLQYLLGHTEWIYGVAFSPDGTLFATASEDDSMMLWQGSDGSLASTIEASMGGVTSVDFSPSSPLLAAGSWSGRVGLWQLRDGHLLRTLQGNDDSVVDVAFSPNGELLASASDDHAIRLWQVRDGSLVHTLEGHTAPVHEVAFSPDGAWLASASQDQTIGIWQVRDGSLVRSLQGHSEPVFDVAFSTDGSLLASGSADGTLRLWRVTDGEMLRDLTEHEASVTSVAFSPDSHLLVSGAADGVLRFWGLSEAISLETPTAR